MSDHLSLRQKVDLAGVRARGYYRFVRKTVMARLEAGLFGRGLDQNGEPAAPVVRKRKDKTAIEVSPTRGAFDVN